MHLDWKYFWEILNIFNIRGRSPFFLWSGRHPFGWCSHHPLIAHMFLCTDMFHVELYSTVLCLCTNISCVCTGFKLCQILSKPILTFVVLNQLFVVCMYSCPMSEVRRRSSEFLHPCICQQNEASLLIHLAMFFGSGMETQS